MANDKMTEKDLELVVKEIICPLCIRLNPQHAKVEDCGCEDLDNFEIAILTWHKQEEVKLLRSLLNNMDITGRLANLERQIEQAISRIEKGE